MKEILLPILLIIMTGKNIYSQNPSSIKDTVISMKTYPFFDPNPIPNPDMYYYPYFRFDGFSLKGEKQCWREIILENDYIKIAIFPEIGGKIWGAIEKSTGNEFIYWNSVVKFRDIAMRGPWTSGGLEFNFGIIGHSPTTSTPVDYMIKSNKDGSVSCFLSTTDLITRTRWEVEVNLQKDKAYFTTKTTWHNPTPLTQPYYQWINGAFHAKNDLEFCFPGTHWIGHDGEAHEWPIDDQGRNLSWYSQNNFGGDKSYHIWGGNNDFYACYWHESDFGSVHYSPYDEKTGRKIFLWSQARSGAVWEGLLTDNDGQYVECQSGRLFNQAASTSSQTPFKHYGFEPYSTDIFTEYWFPVKNTHGVKKANKMGVLNIEKKDDDKQIIYFCPTEKLQEDLCVYFNDSLTYKFSLKLNVLETWSAEIERNPPNKPLFITIGGEQFVYCEKKTHSARPIKSPTDFSWQSAYGLFTDGLEWMYQNDFQQAMECFQKCVEEDSNFTPALNQLAELLYRKGEYEKAIQFSLKSLSINTYDPAANFMWGLISKRLGNTIDAQDGFSIASLSPSFRKGAYIELSKLFLSQNKLTKARYYAVNGLKLNKSDIELNKLMAVICRKERKEKEAFNHIQRIRELTRLDHFVNFEQWQWDNEEMSKNTFISLIKSELPYETYLELAGWYREIGDFYAAIKILGEAPAHPLVYLNLAYLHYLKNDLDNSNHYFRQAIVMSPSFVFPFRLEDIDMLEWAIKQEDNWKTAYYLGLLYWNLGNRDFAKELFKNIADQSDFPYFYLARVLLFSDDKNYSAEKDLIKARELGINDWRTSERLIDYYLQTGLPDKALKIAKEAVKKFPENYILNYVFTKCLMANGQYSMARNILTKITILPSEGAQYGRITYRQACIMEAIDLYESGRYLDAIKLIEKARLWPENLGVGKPYDPDERIEDFLEAKCWRKIGKQDEVEKLNHKIISYTEQKFLGHSSADYLYLSVLREQNRYEKIDIFINEWGKSAPDDNVFKWCKAMLQNNMEEAKKIETFIRTQSGGTPWDPQHADPEFEIIKMVSKIS